jgi:hypothetical protein
MKEEGFYVWQNIDGDATMEMEDILDTIKLILTIVLPVSDV